MRGPRHAYLREWTAGVHADVERAVERAGFFTSVTRYADYLRRLHLFHRRLGPLAAAATATTVGHWQLSRRLGLLAEDLAALGCEQAAPETLLRPPATDDATFALGALYVVVGASLGARVLVEQARALELPGGRGDAYLGALAASTDWTGFLAALESEPVSSQEALGEGARATFGTVLDAITVDLS